MKRERKSGAMPGKRVKSVTRCCKSFAAVFLLDVLMVWMGILRYRKCEIVGKWCSVRPIRPAGQYITSTVPSGARDKIYSKKWGLNFVKGPLQGG